MGIWNDNAIGCFFRSSKNKINYGALSNEDKLLNFLPEQTVIFQRLVFILWPWIDKMLGKRGNKRKTIKNDKLI